MELILFTSKELKNTVFKKVFGLNTFDIFPKLALIGAYILFNVCPLELINLV